MSSGVSPSTESNSFGARFAAIERESQALVGALSGSQRTRQLVFLALVAIVCITCYAFYKLATRFQQKEQMDALVAKAQERLEDNSDYLMREVQTLVDVSAPVLSEAFYEQAKHDLPGFLQAMQSERNQFVESLQAKLEVKLNAHYEMLLDRHQRLLAEEFPAVTDAKLHEAMMANLRVAVDKLVRKYYIEKMRDELLAMYATWDEFPPAPPAAEGEPRLEDQLVAELLELLKLKLAETPTPVVSTTP
ncbi:MAG: hypothetical protein EXS05_18250 [Planctomycetaceae bacterium]|nr:hypothetical protein [Planctomycetaceae bacterium]